MREEKEKKRDKRRRKKEARRKNYWGLVEEGKYLIYLKIYLNSNYLY